MRVRGRIIHVLFPGLGRKFGQGGRIVALQRKSLGQIYKGRVRLEEKSARRAKPSYNCCQATKFNEQKDGKGASWGGGWNDDTWSRCLRPRAGKKKINDGNRENGAGRRHLTWTRLSGGGKKKGSCRGDVMMKNVDRFRPTRKNEENGRQTRGGVLFYSISQKKIPHHREKRGRRAHCTILKLPSSIVKEVSRSKESRDMTLTW